MIHLVKNTPADGLVAGIGSVNRDLVGEANANCILMSYDYTVLAGTQGQQNHRKKDRMFEIAEKQRQRRMHIEPKRGTIYDRNGMPLAVSDPRSD